MNDGQRDENLSLAIIAYGVGTETCSWLENALSTPLLLTEVTT